MTREQLQELIADLTGTCKSTADGLAGMGLEGYELSPAECEELDESIFNCETCGWWFERSEQGRDEVCLSCDDDYET